MSRRIGRPLESNPIGYPCLGAPSTSPEVPTFRLDTSISYDRTEGVLNVIDEHVHEQIRVRQNLVEESLRVAVIVELERLGYTVISPEEQP